LIHAECGAEESWQYEGAKISRRASLARNDMVAAKAVRMEFGLPLRLRRAQTPPLTRGGFGRMGVGEIATPVCALARNDMVAAKAVRMEVGADCFLK